MTHLDAFEALVLRRQATRDFLPDAVDPDLLARLLRCAQRAPSGYNLQPWVCVVITDPKQRAALCKAALGQRQVHEAPTVVVFAASTRPAARLRDIVEQGVSSGHWPVAYAQGFLARYVRVRLGLPWLSPVLALGARMVGLFRPSPDIPATRAARAAYATKQLMLAVDHFLLAATAAGVATCPMEGIDPARVRRVAGLPRHYVVPVIVPLGYAASTPARSPRLPLHTVAFDGRYGATWRAAQDQAPPR